MATHHSRPKRTKGSDAQIVVPSWDKVWRSFRESNESTTIEAMNAEGWKTVKQAAEESGYAANYINSMALRGKKLELVKKKVNYGTSVREVNFVRPKLEGTDEAVPQ